MISGLPALAVVVALIAANGFFVAAEFALVASDRNRIEAQAAAGDRRARQILALLKRLSFHLSGAQLGITITSLLIGLLAAPVVAELLRPLLEPLVGERAVLGVGVTVALVSATVFQMIVGELMPKGYAIARPEGTARRLTPILRVYGFVFGPLIRFLNGAANMTVRRLGVEPREELASVRTLPEFELLFRLSAADGRLAGSAARLLDRSVRLSRKTAADALVPRVEVQALAHDASVAELVALSAATGHSRFPVHGADLDDVRGVVHVKAVMDVPRAERSSTSVGELMTDALAVPESRDLDDLLHDMRSARLHMAVVVDEYGGTAGIITLEDVIEEIVGDISDEHDVEAVDLARRTAPGVWLVDASLHADEVMDLCGFSMGQGPFETLAGFVLERLGELPEPGDEVRLDGWVVRVVSMDRRRIATVELTAPPEDRPGVAGVGRRRQRRADR
ncbi:MAG: HlyC/CorC family transporter [Acidimicrobiia bacterium]|nr:HlyC/CorC family transporter [Acidimicrobiia bacterium]